MTLLLLSRSVWGGFLGFILQPLFERYIHFDNNFLSFIRSCLSVFSLFFI